MKEKFNFNDIGKKIKTFTQWACWITIILCWIAAGILFLAALATSNGAFFLVALGLAVVMPFITWVGSWMMYALGELVDTNMEIRDMMKQQAERPAAVTVAAPQLVAVSAELPKL